MIKRIDTEAGRSFGLARLRQKWLIKRSAKYAAYSLALCLSWHLRGKNIPYCKVLLQAQVYHTHTHTHTHKNIHIVLKFWNRKFCSMTFYNRSLSSLILNRFLTQNEPRKILNLCMGSYNCNKTNIFFCFLNLTSNISNFDPVWNWIV